MGKINARLDNLDQAFPTEFTSDQLARAKTVFLKKLSLEAHRFYGGKIQTLPKVGAFGFNWFNVWYTPGVSAVSTTIRDHHEASYDLSNRGNLVAVVSDSTRCLGDGDVSPSGGLGVMEGKAFLMKYLGGVDAVALCMDSRNAKGKNDPDAIIEFVKRLQPSFGAVNLEDISQPNCYKVLDVLREECEIPVWHDDAQGTGCVTLAGLLNAVKVAGKELGQCRMVFWGAGASNTTIVRLIIEAGGNPDLIVMFDSKGSLGKHREDVKADARFYRKWEICEKTNPSGLRTIEEAMKGADVLIALSTPGPDTVKPEWVRAMAPNAIVFACANPVPEIYPHAAKEAGALVVATGRGDFPNQVNNSVGFPGILKGALLVRARKITDGMAIAAARSLARFAEKKGLSPDYIIPNMEEADVFPQEAADVAMQAVADGVARISLTREQVAEQAKTDIAASRQLVEMLTRENMIRQPPQDMLDQALNAAIAEIRAAGNAH
ncbi:MAG TPA: malate dehydrogenase [Verrucomicrobia bacterium]|nr:MAG: malate dehydrogenase [Lentisphaerae bacterium GWF2_57_35]HBA85320.1 malate dehydrogenase [Verrucomicrobiota bacterium]